MKSSKPVPQNPIQYEQDKFDRECLDNRRKVKWVEGDIEEANPVHGTGVPTSHSKRLKSALKKGCFDVDNSALNLYRLTTMREIFIQAPYLEMDRDLYRIWRQYWRDQDWIIHQIIHKIIILGLLGIYYRLTILNYPNQGEIVLRM